MAVMGERLPEAWMVELHRNGRVEFPLRRWALLQLPVVPLLLVTLGPAGRIPDMLDSGWRFVGYLMIVAYVGVAVAIIWQLVTQRPVVIVDRTGIRHGRRRFIAWSEIESIGPLSGSKLAWQFPVMPKDVWAKNLVLSRHQVNDLPAFRTWLEELLAEHRQLSQAE